MATDGPDDELLLEAYAIIDTTPEMDETIAKLRDLLAVDHVNPVCTENPIRACWAKNRLSCRDDQAHLVCPGRAGLAVQVEDPA